MAKNKNKASEPAGWVRIVGTLAGLVLVVIPEPTTTLLGAGLVVGSWLPLDSVKDAVTGG